MRMGRKKRSANIPEDIVVEILTRLPAKSLLRFKSACKKWCSVVQEPDFVALHHKRSYDRPDGGCLIVTLSDHRLLFSVGYEGGHASLLLEFNRYRALCPTSGLILLVPTHDSTDNPVFVYNPTIRKLVSLPPLRIDVDEKIKELREQDPSVRFRSSYFLGFDQSRTTTGQYKVLCIWTVFRNYKEYYPYVLTLGTKSWRKIDTTFQALGEVVECDHSWCFNGAIHWRVARRRDPAGSIIAFDVGEEKFLMIPPPDKPLDDFYQLMMVEGCLALSNGSEVWVLEDYSKGVWTELKLNTAPLEGHQGGGFWVELKLKRPLFERFSFGIPFRIYRGAIHSGEKFFEARQSQSQSADEILWLYYFDKKSRNEGSLYEVTGLHYPNSINGGCSCSWSSSDLNVSSNVETLFCPSSGLI